MQNLTHLHTATAKAPKLFLKFPGYFGAYTPHCFWHVTRPETSRSTKFPYYHEAVFSASWDHAGGFWNHPKRQSPLYATFSLLQQHSDPANINFNLPHISSIYINPLPHNQSSPYPKELHLTDKLSKTLNNLCGNPTADELYNFAMDPSHTWNKEQQLLWTRRLLQHFNSATKEGLYLNEKWNTFQLLHNPPDEDGRIAKLDLGVEHVKGRANLLPLSKFEEVKALIANSANSTKHQLYGTNLPTATNPLGIRDFPQKFGHYEFRQFWIQTSKSITTGRQYETVMSRHWVGVGDNSGHWGQWAPAEVVSAKKDTICVLCIEQDPTKPNYSLPTWRSVNLYPNGTPKDQVYEFAESFVFTGEQKSLLVHHLLANGYTSNDTAMQTLYRKWQSMPQIDY